MNSCMTLTLAALAGLALACPAAAQPKPQTFNPADVKAAVKKAVDVHVIDFGKQFPHLTLANPCTTEFNNAVNAAKAERTACLDANNPPAGSPLAAFNALSNVALAQKCAGQTLDACVAGVVKDQAKFCALQAAKELSRAKTTLAKCCGPLDARKAEVQKELAAIEADVRSCLNPISPPAPPPPPQPAPTPAPTPKPTPKPVGASPPPPPRVVGGGAGSQPLLPDLVPADFQFVRRGVDPNDCNGAFTGQRKFTQPDLKFGVRNIEATPVTTTFAVVLRKTADGTELKRVTVPGLAGNGVALFDFRRANSEVCVVTGPNGFGCFACPGTTLPDDRGIEVFVDADNAVTNEASETNNILKIQ